MNFNDSEPRQQETPQKPKASGANPPNKENQKLIRRILEESVDGLNIADLFLQLQTRDAVIPEWVQKKGQVNSYIPSFIGALRKELEPEKKTITKSPYRIIPSSVQDHPFRRRLMEMPDCTACFFITTSPMRLVFLLASVFRKNDDRSFHRQRHPPISLDRPLHNERNSFRFM